MWSIYAEDHKGYLVGIDLGGLELAVSEGSPIGRFRPVVYEEERVMVTPKRDDFAYLYSKSLDWKCEEESRIVLPLPLTDDPVHVKSFGIHNLREIVVGYKAGDDLRKEIELLGSSYPAVKIRQARPSGTKHEMILI
jgi:hypothetical protein